MSEIEKRPEAELDKPVLKSSHKFEAFLSYHLDQAEWVDELPGPVRLPFKAMLSYARKHKDELFGAVDDDALDEFFAQYADLLLQLRSDDAIAARVVAFDWDEEQLRAFDYYLEHKAEIEGFVEKAASVSDGEPRKELGPSQVPGQLSIVDELEDLTGEDEDG